MSWTKRILLIFFTIIFSSTITFVIIRMMPGDPVMTYARELERTRGISILEATRQAKAMLHYDPDIPIVRQYVEYLKDVFTGNLGYSMQMKASVTTIIGSALLWTLFVSSIALFLSFALGSLLGMYVAWKRKSVVDPILTLYDSIVGALPSFVIAYLLLILFSIKLGWFPARGNYSASVTPGWNLPFIASIFQYGALPILSWVLTSVGGWALGMKAMAVNIYGEDYILSARARGLKQGRIIWTYVGRNALLPQVTSLAMTFGGMFAGSVMIENMFVYPGMGYFFNRAIGTRDYPLMQGMFLVITIAVVFANQFAEILYALIDPRVRERS